ncbi:MAG: lipoprotein insertase outer membrane protein LolB [Proteobacteria bacterium]|nr:lipoprotein insertase outer membrane protein LolB [Pseudomonadota bacterium]
MRFALLLLAGFLAACAQMPGQPVALEAQGDFEMAGRVAIKHAGEGASGAITWRHSRDADDLFLTSPIGQGIARITRIGDQVRLTTVDGKSFEATDAEALTEQVLGWRLPLKGLPDWVQARPVAGGDAEITRDAAGQPAEIRQSGWRIEYLAWRDALPSRLTFFRDNLEIKLVVDRWILPP